MKRPFAEVDGARLNRQPTKPLKIEAPPLVPRPPRIRLKRNRILHRSLDSHTASCASRLGISPLDSLGFFSRPTEIRTNNDEELIKAPGVPFTVACANTCSLTAVGYEAGIVQVFDHSPNRRTSPRATLFELRPCTNAIFHVEWSKNDKMLAIASGAQDTSIYDVTKQSQICALDGHTGSVKDVKFSPNDPNLCTTGGRDGMLLVWDLRVSSRGALKSVVSMGSVDHRKASGRDKRFSQKPASITAVLFKADNKILSSCAENSTISTWDMRYAQSDSLEQSRGIKPLRPGLLDQSPSDSPKQRSYGITSMVMSHEEQRVYALTKNHRILEFQTAHPCAAPIGHFACPSLRVATFYCKLSLSNDGLLLCGNASGSPIIIDSQNHRPNIRPARSAPQSLNSSQDQENIQSSPVSSADDDQHSSVDLKDCSNATSLSNAGKRLDATSGTISKQMNGGHRAECTGTSWSHDSESFVTIGDDALVRIWRRDVRRSGLEIMECETGMTGDWGWA